MARTFTPSSDSRSGGPEIHPVRIGFTEDESEEHLIGEISLRDELNGLKRREGTRGREVGLNL